MPMYQFVLAIVMAVYVSFWLQHLRFLTREPLRTGILKVLRLPPPVHLLALSGLCIWA
jgi:hypothetical protein